MKEQDALSCGDVEERLAHYVADELPLKEALRVGDHLLYCEKCRIAFDELEEVKSSLGRAEPIIPSPSLKEQVRLRVLEEMKSGRRSSRRRLFRKPFPLYRIAMAAFVFYLFGVASGFFFLSLRKTSPDWRLLEQPVLTDSSAVFSVTESRFQPDTGKM